MRPRMNAGPASNLTPLNPHHPVHPSARVLVPPNSPQNVKPPKKKLPHASRRPFIRSILTVPFGLPFWHLTVSTCMADQTCCRRMYMCIYVHVHVHPNDITEYIYFFVPRRNLSLSPRFSDTSRLARDTLRPIPLTL